MTALAAGDTAARRLDRDTLVVSACTLMSRITGFGRVLATAAVLGSGLLGDVYQTANMLPNLLFELVALGVLQAVLLPAFVEARRHGGDASLGVAARATLGTVVAALGIVAAVGMVASPLVARLMVAADPSAAVRAEKLDVMVPMALVFVPQLVFYGIATTASAALNAMGRFVAAALAPAVNNVLVIIACLLFRWARNGAVADLHLSPFEFALIAGGTTVGVIAFGVAPLLALRLAGVGFVPRWDPHHPAVRAMRRSFGWATLSIVGTLVPTATALLLGNGAPGGVAVFVFCFAFYVLPHALVAVPAATALAPRVADRYQSGDVDGTRVAIDQALSRAVPLLWLGGAGMMALAWQVADAMAFGQIASQGLEPIGYTLVAFGPGLAGYGVAFLLTRVLFALGDLRAASRLMIAGAVSGVITMVVASSLLPATARSAALAAGYGTAQTVTALLLARRTFRLTGAAGPARTLRLHAGSVAAAGISVVTMMTVAGLFGDRRRESAVAILVAGLVGSVVFAVAFALSRGRGVGEHMRRVWLGGARRRRSI